MCKISEMNLETAKYYGYEAQSNQLVEECAELIQAVNKYRRVETGLGQPVAEDKKAIARDNLVEKIKEDTYYRCIEGEIVEVTEDGEIVEE